MVKQNFLTRMLLLFALVVGSVTSVWAEDVIVFEENFSQFTSASTTALTSLTSGNYGDWSDVANVYPEIGFIKFSSSSKKGKMTTPKLSDLNGSATLTFKLGKYSSKTGTLKITINNAGTIDGEASLNFSTQNINQNGWSSDYSVVIEDGTSETTITFESTSERFYLDDIKIVAASGTQDPSVATTVTINASGIKNTDVYTSTTAGSLSATVSAGGNSISGATVSWSSSNTGVATIDASGAVTLVAAGTTTITASYAGVEDVYQPSSATYEMTVTNSDPNAPGTENNPYTVAQAIAATPSSGTSENVYIKGIVSKFYNTSIVGDGSNYRYYISDDGTETNQLLVYRGKGLNEATFDADDLLLGDEVVIYGGLTTYNDTKEVAANNYIVSLIRPEKPKHNVTFSINGIAGEPVEVEEDAAITFPEVTAPEGYTFLGWTTAEISGEQASAPTDLLTEATMGTADITYYAVFAVVSGTPTTLTKMVSGDTFSAGDNIVIVANVDEETAYALYQETQSNSYVKYYSFTANAETVGANDKNWLTVSAGSDGKWKLGDATNGYLYTSGSNNLSIDITNSTDWTLEDNNDGTFKLKGGSNNRYVSCRSDLKEGNQYLFRMAGGTPAGVYSFDIYKFVAGSATYSNYCTTVPTGVTVTIASSGYTTLSSAHALDFSSSITGLEAAYVVSALTGTKASFTKISKAVPAETGLVLKGTAGAKVTIPFAASADELTGTNYLMPCVNGGTVEASTTYAMSGGKFKLYTGTELPVGKAYLLKSDVDAAASNGQGAPELSFDFGEGTTGIQNIERTMNDNQYYTLDGRRVAQPTKGLYIVNGKKVLVP